ncbi:MAG: hypothetical protein JSU63_00020 [Phycisphaerales bacterium]|nr:MAG: hypothetical protein JSU63_00020 [Phycisphaerales bacterium]
MLHEVWTCSTHGHTIEIKSRWLGFKEVIYHDGRKVASGLTVFGGKYAFRVEEDTQPVDYNVRLQTTLEGIEVTVTRNDETVYSQTTQ